MGIKTVEKEEEKEELRGWPRWDENNFFCPMMSMAEAPDGGVQNFWRRPRGTFWCRQEAAPTRRLVMRVRPRSIEKTSRMLWLALWIWKLGSHSAARLFCEARPVCRRNMLQAADLLRVKWTGQSGIGVVGIEFAHHLSLEPIQFESGYSNNRECRAQLLIAVSRLFQLPKYSLNHSTSNLAVLTYVRYICTTRSCVDTSSVRSLERDLLSCHMPVI